MIVTWIPQRRDLLGQHAGEALHRPLGRLVRTEAGRRVASAHGGDLDDVAGALLAQDGQRGAADVDHAPEVRLDLRAEVLVGEVLDRVDVRVARVVDEHVEAPESVDGGLDRGIGLRAVGHVEGDGARPVGKPVDEIGELVGVARRRNELVACFQDGLGEGAAEAA
jgi:hypothetical protein